ncbi:MAG: MFS transporter, partial [Solobacterium sp.]|nr:MFS transporter [Solobacterium sp.]
GIFPFQKGILVLILFSAIFTVPSFFLIFRRPVPEAVPPMGGRKTAGAEEQKHTGSLLILIMLFAIVGAPRIASLFTNYLSIFSESIGYSSSFSAFLASILMFANITAKFAYGFLSDKVGTWKATILCQISVIIGVSLFLFLPQYPVLLAVGTLGYGMFYGLTTVAINRMCMAAFGFTGTRKYQGMITSVASLAAVIGSPAIGVVYDNTGSFNLLFAILLVLMAATIILSVITARMRPQNPKTPA